MRSPSESRSPGGETAAVDLSVLELREGLARASLELQPASPRGSPLFRDEAVKIQPAPGPAHPPVSRTTVGKGTGLGEIRTKTKEAEMGQYSQSNWGRCESVPACFHGCAHMYVFTHVHVCAHMCASWLRVKAALTLWSPQIHPRPQWFFPRWHGFLPDS